MAVSRIHHWSGNIKNRVVILASQTRGSICMVNIYKRLTSRLTIETYVKSILYYIICPTHALSCPNLKDTGISHLNNIESLFTMLLRVHNLHLSKSTSHEMYLFIFYLKDHRLWKFHRICRNGYIKYYSLQNIRKTGVVLK